jgi:hypothetical protein
LVELADRLNLDLAFKRVKKDIQEQCFISHPYEIELIESDFDVWINTLREKLREKLKRKLNFDKSVIIDIPKKGWHLRPGNILTLEDHVIYSAILLDGIEQIKKHTSWSAKKKRFSFILLEDQSKNEWFEFRLGCWELFRKECLELINKEYDWMSVARKLDFSGESPYRFCC